MTFVKEKDKDKKHHYAFILQLNTAGKKQLQRERKIFSAILRWLNLCDFFRAWPT